MADEKKKWEAKFAWINFLFGPWNILANKRLRGKMSNKFEAHPILLCLKNTENCRQSLCVLNGLQIYGKLFLSRRKRITENYSSRQRLESGKHLTCINISEHNLFLRQNEAAKCRGAVYHPQKNDNKKIKYTFYSFFSKFIVSWTRLVFVEMLEWDR
jgi:hypothetical protein